MQNLHHRLPLGHPFFDVQERVTVKVRLL